MTQQRQTFLIFAPGRTGHHAVLTWFMAQLSKQADVTFYNNVDLARFHGGQLKLTRKQVYSGGKISKDNEFDPKVVPADDITPYRVVSFEDRLLENYSKMVVPSPLAGGTHRCIVILRDPYNFAASYLRSLPLREKFTQAEKAWIQHAREWVGETKYLPGDTVFISYNRWCRDPDYRRDVAHELGIKEPEDLYFNHVPTFGSGSSFDGVAHNSRGNSMSTEKRWLMMKDTKRWQEFITRRIDNLSKEIFGFDLDDLIEQEGAGRGSGPYVRIQHPADHPIHAETSADRVNEFVKFLETTPLGDYDWHTKVGTTPEMRTVENYQHVFENRFQGRGIVICAGGGVYLPTAWILVNRIRDLGCDLPIQIWFKDQHYGTEAPAHYRRPFLDKFNDVTFIDSHSVRTQVPIRRLGGWEMKCFAIANSNLKEVILLDADNIPLIDVSSLFETTHYRETGALFWPDRGKINGHRPFHEFMDIPVEKGDPEWESGQIVVDKERHWRPLQLALWMNSWSDWWYKHFHGDKETFHLAWKKLGAAYTMHPPMKDLTGWDCICQHGMDGERIFQHRNGKKYRIGQRNPDIKGFVGNDQYKELLDEYRTKVLEGGALIP